MICRMLALNGCDDVVVAQIEAFKLRVPILYAVLSINTVALAATHIDVIPLYLSVYAPGIGVAFMVVRGFQWYRARHRTIGAEQARRMIRHTTAFAVLLAFAMLVWGCLLYDVDYGVISSTPGITRRGHAVLYIGLTVICCISLLMHVRLSALLVTLIVIVPFCCFLLVSGTAIEQAVSINLGLVALGMLYVLFVFSRDFEALVRSKSELRAVSAHQEELANTDSLTGLANRRRFFSVLESLQEERESFALLAMDLDGFKQVNDVHGHPIGDQVLIEVAKRITAFAPDALCIARLGGDEFSIIHPVCDPDTLAEMAKAIVRSCDPPFVVSYRSVVVGVSVGISIVDGADTSTGSGNPVEQADYALSHVKQSGKGRFEIFAPRHEHSIRRRSVVEQALRSADLESEIRMVFQPIVDADSAKIVAYEALARWDSPVLGEVPPAEFVPIAEQCEVIHALTRTVMVKALATARQWPEHLRVKINLSARDIGDAIQMLRLLGILDHSGVRPSRVTFELTETAFGDDLDAIDAAVELVRASGVSLAIDDFGIGYSSLSCVHRLNPDLIKIDRSFVQRLGLDHTTESIIKTVVELCRNIGADCLAEGVETNVQREMLLSLGVQHLQGYLFGRPMPSSEIAVGHNAAVTSAA